MEDLINMHGAIMDQYDPEKKLGMIVDEWGTWFTVEPGTNPGFLYQQNTMRDALVACINLNIFNKHSDRVKMACIAQMVNVLQSVILTEGAKMVKTPTWHVFNLFKEHQDATLVESFIETKQIGEEEEYMVPDLSESASVDADGRLHITIGNLSVTDAAPVDAAIAGLCAKSVKAQILADEMHAKNTFDAPDTVHSREFEVELTAKGFRCTLPPCSVVHITVEQ